MSPAAWTRGAGLLGLWIVLIGVGPADLVAGALTVAGATWVSLRALAPQAHSLRPLALPALAWRFVRGSVAGGVDVARRALDPRLPLRPGFTDYAVGFPPGLLSDAFATLTSLLPGTVVVGRDEGRLIYHCLDTELSVEDQLAGEEAALRRALRGSPS